MARIPHFPRPWACQQIVVHAPRKSPRSIPNPVLPTPSWQLRVEKAWPPQRAVRFVCCGLSRSNISLCRREKTTRSHLQRKGFKPQRNSSDPSACFRLHRKALAAISFLTKFTPLSVHRCRMQPCDSCRSQLLSSRCPVIF